ncbi:NAD(+)/NADH kinase [bacterium]|nr:NAD(+)/NADH kinase [bacterium]
MFEKLVLVTRKTRLEELVLRFNSRGQAKFYIEHAGGDFQDYVKEDDVYRRSLDVLRGQLELGLKLHPIERAIVPTFLFAEKDLVVTAGQDGLVANTAKYVGNQPIVAVNPDPERFDGVLLPFAPEDARAAVARVLEGRALTSEVTLAEAVLQDGQRLLAFNDLFIGPASHVSARYVISHGERKERQSSSGVLVSTGAGSTGWLSSVWNMASGISAFAGGTALARPKLEWEDPRLAYVVREPFASKASQATLVAGLLAPGEELVLESLMPSRGVVFSDGVEADFLAFDSGAVARVRASSVHARLVVP